MANCHGCYWSDRHPETHLQEKHMEPDFLDPNIKAGDSPPDVRIVQSCGAGCHYYKSYGAQDHNCNKFQSEEAAAEAEAEDISKVREQWAHPTNRIALTRTSNVLIVIERMSTGNSKAFDILTDLMAEHYEDFAKTCGHLDDMNIRGGQIPLAFAYCRNDLQRLITLARERSEQMVKYVNARYAKADVEEAVVRGAHLYGHRPSTKKK